MPDSLARSSVDPLPYEADELVRKMYNHILKDGCIHCKHILQDNNEAGLPSPAPTETATQHHPNQQEVSITK